MQSIKCVVVGDGAVGKVGIKLTSGPFRDKRRRDIKTDTRTMLLDCVREPQSKRILRDDLVSVFDFDCSVIFDACVGELFWPVVCQALSHLKSRGPRIFRSQRQESI